MFSDCILVKGAARSLICDIQRGTYAFIENDIYDLIGELEKCSIEEIKSNFPQSEHLIIENFLAYLNANDFGFYTSHPERFPILNLEWKSPSPITNSIIDINSV